MKIAIDAMGGDHAPREAVEGAYRSAIEDGVALILVGDEEVLAAELERLGGVGERSIEIVHADQVVGMGESAITPIRRKRRSSIRIAAELVKAGEARAMVSAGNTGASMAAAKMVIGTITGVDRPALAAVLPHVSGRFVLLDVGANIDSKPALLRQFAVMGHLYAQEVVGLEEPRIGLLSIGGEEGKGSDLTREVFGVLQQTGLNFVGNVEGGELFEGRVDVAVCDGFVGNILLKSAEGIASFVTSMLREELERSLLTRIGAVLARPAFERFRLRTDYSEYGAAPLLGIAGGCFIAHGRSNAHAFSSAIRRAVEFCEHDVARRIEERLERLHREEEKLLSSTEAGPEAEISGEKKAAP